MGKRSVWENLRRKYRASRFEKLFAKNRSDERQTSSASDLGICMIGHRGFSAKFLMNTELAFTKAAEHHSGGCETDIRRTSDGIYVCSHDRDAVLEDGTRLVVTEHTFEELTAQPLMNKLTDDKVYLCTMRRYLEIMRDNHMICFLELKGNYNDEQLHEIFGMVAEVYDLSKCIMQSFDFSNLLRTSKMFPGMPLMYTYGIGDRHWRKCLRCGFSLDADFRSVSPRMIKAFHKRNLEVALWTANEPEHFAFCKTMDVDYIESDVFGGDD